VNQRIIVSALIKKDDKYLFIKQNKEGGAYPNTLHIPGGGLDTSEDLTEAVKREIKEETNLEITNVQPFDFDSDILNYKGVPTQLIFLRFLADYQSGEAKPGDDAKEIIWLSADEIGKYNHNEPSIRLLKKLAII